MSTELVRIEQPGLSPQEITTMAKMFAESGFFTDTKTIAQAFVKIQAGKELGFPPMASMRDVHIIQGKPAIGANLVAAAIKRSNKYDYKFVQNDEKACVLDFYENGEKIGTSSFSLEDARKAGLLDKTGSLWSKFFRNLSFARAITNGARWYTPDVFLGPIYTPEELGATIDGETGEVIEPAPRAKTPPATTARIIAPIQQTIPEDLENARRKVGALENAVLDAGGKLELEEEAVYGNKETKQGGYTVAQLDRYAVELEKQLAEITSAAT